MTKDNIIPFVDPLLPKVLKKCIEENMVSTARIQKLFSLPYARAVRLIVVMVERGYVSYEQNKILITKEEYSKIFGEEND